jgi:hypothetical protein
MAIPCPPLEWPSFLQECGPANDPQIVLRGDARIGDTPLQVVAIRVDPELRYAPDYRRGVPAEAYETAALETTLDELEYLTEELSGLTGRAQRSIVRLAGGAYVLWVLPAR